MRTHLARSVLSVVVLSILCGCTGGRKSYSPGLSMSSLNPFKSPSQKLADSAAPRFEKPSSTADPADSLPPAAGYASKSDRQSPSVGGAYPEKAASYAGLDRATAQSYRGGQSPISSGFPVNR